MELARQEIVIHDAMLHPAENLDWVCGSARVWASKHKIMQSLIFVVLATVPVQLLGRFWGKMGIK